MKYYIALGSNQGASEEIFKCACKSLEYKGCKIISKSALYKTKPWGKTDQPVFLNSVIEINFDKGPDLLLKYLLSVEKEFGRKRIVHWGPRTLDLDIIYADDVYVNTKTLKIPHPFFWDRAFVLIPLCDIRPEFKFKNQTIKSRIEELNGYEDVIKYKLQW